MAFYNVSILRLVFLAIGLVTLLTIFIINMRVHSDIEINTMFINTAEILIRGEVLSQRSVLTDNRHNTSDKRNVLFIIVDDLRPQLEPYLDERDPGYFGKVKIRTPNLRRLAARSIVFKRAYCQQSLCGPSRASMLTSRRPDVTRAFTNKRYWRETGGNFTTLPQHFKDNGYLSLGFSKVFHPKESSNNDDPPSWSEPYYNPPYADMHYLKHSSGASWAMVSEAERRLVPLPDDNTVKHAKLALQRIANTPKEDRRPFFLAVGFRKPHLSLVCPEEYFHWYPLEDKTGFMKNKSWETPTVNKMCHLSNATVVDGQLSLPADALRHLRRAYFACISYMDSNVGELLDEVQRLGLDGDTIITFVADHGYHLGENSHWGKMTSAEMANHIPLMIHVPGVTNQGLVTESLVEAVDLYPTLVEAAGLDPIPPCPVNCSDVRLCTQGVSLLPLLEDPNLELKSAAFSQVTALDDTRYTIRTKRFRYIEKAKGKKAKLPDGRFKFSLEWDNDGTTMELYDHYNDTLEEYNLANDPDFAEVLVTLRSQLHEYAQRLQEEPKRI